MRRHHDARTPREVASGVLGEIAARTGTLQLAGGDVVDMSQFGLVNQIARRLGESGIVAAIGAGPPRRNRKPVIQLLRKNGSTIGFAKVGWSPMTTELVTNEARWLRAVAGRLPDPIDAPRVVLHDTFGDNEVVVTTPLQITPTFTTPSPVADEVVIAVGRCLGSTVKTVREIVGGRGLTDSCGPAITTLLERHSATEIEVGLWHGDFTPWNMASTKGRRLVWDWEFAGDDRPIGFDLIHRELERVRRAAANNEAAAVDAAMAFTSPAWNLDGDQLEATRCLYLAEIIARETRLADQGWVPESLGPLDRFASDELDRRLA